VSEELQQKGRALSLAVIAEMYRDPFWDARFGPRGRTHADEDAGRHIEHLIVALRAGSQTLFTEYGRWLRAVLTTRGMCTRHLGDNFALLADAIEREGIADGARAAAYLRSAQSALYDAPGAAGVLYRERAAIVDAVIARAGGSRDDLDYHVTFLADAVLHAQPALFAGWVQFKERAVPLDALEEVLRARVEDLSPALAALAAAR
jgi:hypothetical protein